MISLLEKIDKTASNGGFIVFGKRCKSVCLNDGEPGSSGEIGKYAYGSSLKIVEDKIFYERRLFRTYLEEQCDFDRRIFAEYFLELIKESSVMHEARFVADERFARFEVSHRRSR